MNIPIKSKNQVSNPPQGYVFPFIDSEDYQLKAKLSDGIVVNYSNVSEQLKVLSLSEYTAFQIFAHDYEIPVGENIDLGGYVNVAIPASLTEEIKICSQLEFVPEKQNVIIDWGDGTISELKNAGNDNNITVSNNPTYNNLDYVCSHTYNKNGKYIVKIYGTTYHWFLTSDVSKNLICRIFDHDLPIASFINRFASTFKGSNHLLNVVMFEKSGAQILNSSMMFNSCQNLLSVTGFTSSLSRLIQCNNMFSGCKNLTFTDFKLPSLIEGSGIQSLLHNCQKLQIDLVNLFTNWNILSGQKVDLTKTFVGCKQITCSDIDYVANKLWCNKDIEWKLPENVKYLPFSECSKELRAMIPVSWGGTNNNIDIALKITEQMKNDYTSFQVYAHDTKINAGDLATQQHIKFIGKQGDVIAFAVNPSMTESFKLRSQVQQSKQDVIIEWGDGNYTDVSTIEPEVLSDGAEYRYLLSHTYNVTGTYIVKIYGKSYFSFTSSGSETTSLISRVFEKDLPIAKHIWNLSSAFQHSNRLLRINMWSHSASYQIIHWSGGFTSARNLIECVGFSKYSHRESNYNMFQNCINLVNTDLRIAEAPSDMSTGDAYTFTNCPKLQTDVSSLLPVQGFKNVSTINVARLFKKCVSLKGSVPANMLWNNKNINWLNTNQAFSDCSEEIRNQVPISWGGLADDSIIEKSIEEKLQQLMDRISQLENK